MMHTLIVGAAGVGKSTLIRRVVYAIDRPLSGFETRKEDSLADPIHGSPVYIYTAGQPHVQTEHNLLGHCKNRHPETYSAAFDRYAPTLEHMDADGRIIVMDEIGTMEAASEKFCAAIMKRLDGTDPVIAAVKHKDTPFLNAVRSHPNCRCFYITEENRDALYHEVLAFMQAQLT